MTALPEDATRDVVEATKAYYDGDADTFYREIWGENMHIGLFQGPEESLHEAMHRANERIAEGAGLKPGVTVLEVACGYGGTARYLARTHGCSVLATNISEKELAWGRDLTAKEGLSDKVSFDYADYHQLSYPDNSFDAYWSQEAFLHAADRAAVLKEAFRVLKPGGRLVVTDILVRRWVEDADREKIYARVHSPDIWDAPDYLEAMEAIGFNLVEHHDWADNIALTYNWVRDRLIERRDYFSGKMSPELVDKIDTGLQFWVDSGRKGMIGWGYFVAEKPAG